MNVTDLTLDAANLPFVEELLAQYLHEPSSVEPGWRAFFDQLVQDDPDLRSFQRGCSLRPPTLFGSAGQAPVAGISPGVSPQVSYAPERRDSAADQAADGLGQENGSVQVGAMLPEADHMRRTDLEGHDPLPIPTRPGSITDEQLRLQVWQDRVDQLIRAFRVRGHLSAELDPLGRPVPEQPELDPKFYGFTEPALDQRFSTRTIKGSGVRTLREIVQRMRNTYCRSIGVQFMHIDDLHVRHWLQERLEGTENRLEMSRADQLRVLENLTNSVLFEEFIQKKFQGAKRFSLEGAETLIPMLDLAIETAGEQGIREVILGMAHRGRLNVLANIMGKSAKTIFREFADTDPDLHRGRGDVKYHLGYSRDWVTSSGKNLHVSLCFNPSHLEFVNPVALGRTRAKQDRRKDTNREKVMALLIHGDAAFAGEGVVQESLNLSYLPAYQTGGTLHIVVNNQVGFTTPPEQGRSTSYATDIAKMLQVPIFHVNGEDPEAVSQVVKLSMDFRREFQQDVVIDLYCYRKHGHNEGDDPSYTQPEMYRLINQKPGVREGYLQRLLALKEITRQEADAIEEQRREALERDLAEAKSETFTPPPEKVAKVWTGYYAGLESTAEEVDTSLPVSHLSDLLLKQTEVPPGFSVHPRLERMLFGARKKMAQGQTPLDWGAAETLAFASLLAEGHNLRMSGQDSQRGTFSHRHSVLHDYKNPGQYMPLQHLAAEQGRVEILNSTLSEAAILGFEYGYSLDSPSALVIWEAQFGDFCNAAQVIIDQFIVSAEDKWNRFSGLVLLLPHGFEGAGPEHSSARLERFLMLAADDNIQIANPTTPAQYFHLLRRQVIRKWRKPLVVMTPKSGLRHPRATSALQDLASGGFHQVLPDLKVEPSKVDKILLCSGKLAYELEAEREKLERDDVAILRLEQLYPLGDHVLPAALSAYPEGTPVIWVQEEPENMGAWRFLRCRLGESLCSGRHPFVGVTRPESASPATGSAAAHKAEQQDLISEAFAAEPASLSGAKT